MIISIKDKAYQGSTDKGGIKRLLIWCAGHRKQSAGPQGHPRKFLIANNISIKDTDKTAIWYQLTASCRLRKWSQVNFLLANLFITTSFQADSWKNWRWAIKKAPMCSYIVQDQTTNQTKVGVFTSYVQSFTGLPTKINRHRMFNL